MSDSESIQFQMDGGDDTESIQFQDAENESLHLGSTTRSLGGKRTNHFAKLCEANSEIDNRSIAFVVEEENGSVASGARPSGVSSIGENAGGKKQHRASSSSDDEVHHGASGRNGLHRRETKKFVAKRQSDNDAEDDQSSLQFAVESTAGGGEDNNRRSPALSQNDQGKKTVVSNTIRQRASSLKGLARRSSGASTSSAIPSSSSHQLRVTIEVPQDDDKQQCDESEGDVVVPSPFPSMSIPASQPPPPLAVNSIRHQRTDSNKLVLEHLRDQEASNLFVQHKAAMALQVTTPTAMSTPTVHERTETDTFPTLMEAVSGRGPQLVTARSESNSRTSSPLGPPVVASGGRTAPERRRSQSASSQGSLPLPSRNGGAPPPSARVMQDGYHDIARSRHHRHADAFASLSLLEELLQTQRFTEEVHRFNSTQEKELQRIKQRLETAKLNDSTINLGAAMSRRQETRSTDRPAGALKKAAEELKDLVETMAQRDKTGAAGKQQRGGKRGYASTDREAKGSGAVSRSPSPNAAVFKVAPAEVPIAAGKPGKPRVPEAFNKLSTRTAVSQQKAEIFASTAKSLGIVWPPATSTSSKSFAVDTLRPGTVVLYFTTGVRLTSNQIQNFFAVAEKRFDDNVVLSHQGKKSESPVAGSSGNHHLGVAFSSHGSRSPSVVHSSSAGAGTARRKSRTDVLRNAFDLLDLRQSGVIAKSDLSMLKELMREECDVDFMRRRTRQQHDGRQDASLIVTAAVSQAEDKFAFNVFPVPKQASSAQSPRKQQQLQQQRQRPSSVSQYNPFALYGCRDEGTFRKLCEFNHDVILPLLSQHTFDEIEFSYFSMIVLQTVKELSVSTSAGGVNHNSKGIGSAARFAERIETYFDCLA